MTYLETTDTLKDILSKGYINRKIPHITARMLRYGCLNKYDTPPSFAYCISCKGIEGYMYFIISEIDSNGRATLRVARDFFKRRSMI